MQFGEWLSFCALFVVVIAFVKPLGLYIAKVLDPRGKTLFDRALKPVERTIYCLCRIEALEEQTWKEYLFALLWFSVCSVFFTAAILAFQSLLPLNPQHLPAPSWHLNLNTSISFITNTDWQSYAGEGAMSYFSQMAALSVQNFTSAAVGLSTAAALVRGIVRRNQQTIGNFWVDCVRVILYLLLPISTIAAVLLIGEGVPQNFHPYVEVQTVEGGRQLIAQGPIASQEAIKLLGTNGGGFTNANSAHPYENPTPLSNFLQMLLIFLIPAAQIYYFGHTVGNTKHGWCVFAALAALFIAGVALCTFFEAKPPMEWSELGLTGGNWEGKEQRFGIFGSALYACVTTAISCGAVNAMHDSFSPLGGFFPMLNMQLSEAIFGGIGAGLCNVLLYVFLSIFVSGLIIGHTPEYLGKKIESFQIKMAVLAILPFILIVHLFSSWACFSEWGVEGLHNAGPHGFSEILYAFSSCTANNGSAFNGLASDTIPYNLTLAAAMLLGRFCTVIPVLALAGSLAAKNFHPQGEGTFPVSSWIFICLLVGTILLLGALTFLPALTMGPILEQFFFMKGMLF